nr:hypothetical protein Hi04_10k_c5482_00041 [uncultured bacterium]
MRMRTLALSLTASTLAIGVALAASPHFLKSSGSIESATGDYIASFKEAGLGNTPINYDLEANTTYLFQCFTKSNNKPQGSPNAGGPSSENTQTTITPSNGQITADIRLDVTFPPPSVSCNGNGLHLCLVSAKYTNVVLTDVTDNISEDLPDASITAGNKKFIACAD